MSKVFFNTINLDQNELKVERAKAKGLQDTIEVYFKTNPLKEISPWQMKHHLEYLLGKNVNINSVRRSMSNLKNEKILTKLGKEKMVMGDEGKNEHLYRLTWISDYIKPNGNASIKVIQTELF